MVEADRFHVPHVGVTVLKEFDDKIDDSSEQEQVDIRHRMASIRMPYFTTLT